MGGATRREWAGRAAHHDHAAALVHDDGALALADSERPGGGREGGQEGGLGGAAGGEGSVVWGGTPRRARRHFAARAGAGEERAKVRPRASGGVYASIRAQCRAAGYPGGRGATHWGDAEALAPAWAPAAACWAAAPATSNAAARKRPRVSAMVLGERGGSTCELAKGSWVREERAVEGLGSLGLGGISLENEPNVLGARVCGRACPTARLEPHRAVPL